MGYTVKHLVQSTTIQSYTDSPRLHANIFFGCMQILFWLFFHPKAWKNYIYRVLPGMSSDFRLTNLHHEQWRSKSVWQLLVIGFITSVICVGLYLAIIGTPAHEISIGVGSSLVVFVIFSVTVGLPGAIIGSAVIGITLGSVFGLYGIVFVASVSLAISIVGGIVSTVTDQDRNNPLVRMVSGTLASFLVGGVAIGLAVATAFNMSGGQPGQQLESVGMLLGVPNEVAGGVLVGVMVGLATGVAMWLEDGGSHQLRRTLLISAGLSLVVGTVRILADQAQPDTLLQGLSGLTFGAFSGVTFVLPYALAKRVVGTKLGALAGSLGSSGAWTAYILVRDNFSAWPLLPISLIGVVLGYTFHLWRPILLYPIFTLSNLILFRLDERRKTAPKTLLSMHSAFWDEHQRLPWRGLDKHLLLVLEQNPEEGKLAFEYLAHSQRQRWAAQAAQIELDARQLERCIDVIAIGQAYQNLGAGGLEGPASALLRSFSRVSQDVNAALRQESSYNQRLALSAVENQLDALLRELTRSSEKYALRFRPIATQWRQGLANHICSLMTEVEARQEIDSPYIIGVPLTTQQEIFVGRGDISARIEQLLLDRRRPPLLLYGQRRMGKTSLLNNLGRLLPSTVVPLFVDLQGPVSRSSDHAGMFYYMARSMSESAHQQRGLALAPLSRERLERDPFGAFDEWLAEVEQALGSGSGLLMLDEFEALDHAISRGRFDEESVLGTLRHIIQHRPRFKLLLAGSHTIEEFRRWSSYLINVQVVQIGYLHEAETRQLIEGPVADFALRYEPEASQRIITLTRGHPFLVQLLCAEVVALKNAQDPTVRRLARLEDVSAAVPEALASGDMFFADIAHNQIDAVGRALLCAVAVAGEDAVIAAPELVDVTPKQQQAALRLLLQRDLIERVEGGYRFQVELVRRWFAQEEGA